MRGTQARIHLSHLEHNIHQIKKKIGKAKLCISVKANAYGHGDAAVAQKVLECGAEYLAVASVDEGRRLREEGISAPVLLLGLTAHEEIPDIVRWNLTPFVCDIHFIDLLSAAVDMYAKMEHSTAAGKCGYPVHLKIDTGMGRIGCAPDQVLELAVHIQHSKNLYLEGICTHLAVSDSAEPSDIDYTKKQIGLFTGCAEGLKKAGIDPGIRHCAASGGILLHPEACFDMVRTGILVYGYFPSVQMRCAKNSFDLKPVMELIAPVVSIKIVEKGASVSYGRTWTAEKKTRIATLAIGYGDGIARRLSPGLCVRIRGKNYPVVGRICMDQCMVDIGNEDPVQRWDEACIFGGDNDCNTADSLAKIAQTINYEILTGISARVPRVTVLK